MIEGHRGVWVAVLTNWQVSVRCDDVSFVLFLVTARQAQQRTVMPKV